MCFLFGFLIDLFILCIGAVDIFQYCLLCLMNHSILQIHLWYSQQYLTISPTESFLWLDAGFKLQSGLLMRNKRIYREKKLTCTHFLSPHFATSAGYFLTSRKDLQRIWETFKFMQAVLRHCTGEPFFSSQVNSIRAEWCTLASKGNLESGSYCGLISFFVAFHSSSLRLKLQENASLRNLRVSVSMLK